LDNFNETDLKEEKQKLKSATTYQLLEYIKQNIEIIMNLKNDAMESNRVELENLSATCTSVGSIDSDNLIMVSIKDALVTMNEKSKKFKGDPSS
jgi:hypothetical protein